jgi:hypothetical protein
VTVVLLCGAVPVPSFGNGSLSPVDGGTRVLLFDLGAAESYSVVKNSAPFATVNASRTGVAAFSDVVTVGDRFEISASGTGAEPPSAPTGVNAAGDDEGCAAIRWNANPESDVDFYRVYQGLQSRTFSDSLDVTGATGVALCQFEDGDYYFSVRAHNIAGLLSALSLEVSASVSNGSTQPPLPPAIVQASEGNVGCMEVTWVPNGSPDVVGYVIDHGTQSVAGGDATTYEHTEDVGNTTSHTICGLSDGTHYVAVRSKNFAGMMSAFSREDTVDVVPTAVFIAAFAAEAKDGGVALTWEIWTDESLRGYKLYRSEITGTGAVALNGGRSFDPTLSLWFDDTVEPLTTYQYTLVVIGEDGVEHRSVTEPVTTRARTMSLGQNVPNPFNPSTSISFVVPVASPAVLAVFDVTGALVRELVDEVIPAGRRTVQWDGKNDNGESVSSGAYFYRLTVGKHSATRKMLLLK